MTSFITNVNQSWILKPSIGNIVVNCRPCVPKIDPVAYIPTNIPLPRAYVPINVPLPRPYVPLVPCAILHGFIEIRYIPLVNVTIM